jgi:TRAP-type uncharacterized transport system fused permease subunit
VAVLIYFIVILHYGLASSAIFAIATLVVVSFFTKRTRMGPKKLLDALEGGSRALPEVGTVLVTAGLIAGAFAVTGLGLRLATGLVGVAGGSLFVLVILAGITCFIFGLGLSGIAVYVLSAIFLAPALIMMDVEPVAAHFFVLYLAHAALITPPVCSSSYLAAAIADAPLMKTGWQSCRLGIVIYLVPFVCIYDPALLMVGTPEHIALAAVTALAGVFLLSTGVAGYFFRTANWVERILFFASGMLLLIPGWQTDIIGLGVSILPIMWQVRKRRLPPTG